MPDLKLYRDCTRVGSGRHRLASDRSVYLQVGATVRTFYTVCRDPRTGKQVTLKLGALEDFANFKQVRETAADEVAKIRDVESLSDYATCTLRQLWKAYTESSDFLDLRESGRREKGYTWAKHIDGPLGQYRIGSLSPKITREWFQDRTRCGPVAANHAYRLLSRIISFACFNPKNVLGHIKLNKEESRGRTLTDDEFAALFRAVEKQKPMDRALWTVALYTGQRVGQICQMRWDDLDGDRWYVRPETAKDGRAHEVRLNARVLQVLNAWKGQQTRHKDWIFPASRNDASKPYLVTYRKKWAKVLSDANLSDLRVHDIRHHFATTLHENGTPTAAIAELVGHSLASQVTARYLHATDAVVEQAINILPQSC